MISDEEERKMKDFFVKFYSFLFISVWAILLTREILNNWNYITCNLDYCSVILSPFCDM